MKRVGILGGMGPAATADFYRKLIEETPATRDQDHLPVVIWADPRVPDRSEGLLFGGPDPTPWLREGIGHLQQSGCELLAVACNTAHAYVPALAAQSGLELISIIDSAADAVAAGGHCRAAVVGTAGTLAAGLHRPALTARGLELVAPTTDEQCAVTEVIAAVKAGTAGPAEESALSQVAEAMAARGADCLVSACTELVLVLDHCNVPMSVIDPARELARQVVLAATGAPAAGAPAVGPPVAGPGPGIAPAR